MFCIVNNCSLYLVVQLLVTGQPDERNYCKMH